MFKQRLWTTLILLPLVLFVIYEAPSWMLAGILLSLVAVSGWEWTQLLPCVRLEYRLSYIIVVLLVIWLSHLVFSFWLTLGFLCWVLALFFVALYPRSQSVWGYPLVVGFIGVLFLSLFSNAFMTLYQENHGQDWIVYVFCLIWAADIGAYLAGKRWGRHRLIPNVSPGKTIEGATGGLVFALGVALVGYYLFQPAAIGVWFLAALLTVLMSILGDLFVSMLKRRCHLKDSGHILPGHGGLLDRLDSAIAALPLFYVAHAFLEVGY